MKYIKQFNNHTTYAQSEIETPSVSWCRSENELHYRKYPRDYSKEYMTFEALGDGNICFVYQRWCSTQTQRYMEYSKDGGTTWVRTNNVDNTRVVMTIPMLTGERALVRGDNDTLTGLVDEGPSEHINSFFYSDIEFNVYGNVMSLISCDDFETNTTVSEHMFAYLFYDLYSYYYDPDNIHNAYVVNANNLILPATTLANRCYSHMFDGCTSLITAPKLPATTLAEGCYSHMFRECTSLTTAPDLPATTLTEFCYASMFNSCRSLNYVKAMFTTTPSGSYTAGWLISVSPTGTFVKNAAASWDVTGVDGIPSGWTVQTAQEI